MKKIYLYFKAMHLIGKYKLSKEGSLEHSVYAIRLIALGEEIKELKEKKKSKRREAK